jgi:hypothetical protein
MGVVILALGHKTDAENLVFQGVHWVKILISHS